MQSDLLFNRPKSYISTSEDAQNEGTLNIIIAFWNVGKKEILMIVLCISF